MLQSSLDLADVAHSGDTLATLSRGGNCCFLALLRGDGSTLAAGAAWSSPDSPGSDEVAEMVLLPLDSGLGGGLVSRVVPFTLSGWVWSGLLRRMEGRGEPGTGLVSSLACVGMMGVMRAGVMLA